MAKEFRHTLCGAAALVLSGSLLFGAGLVEEACTPAERQAASTALDVSKTLCLFAHQASPDNVALTECQVEAAAADAAKQFLAGARVAGAKLAVCPTATKDAGSDSGR
jgi:hypothetical protein